MTTTRASSALALISTAIALLACTGTVAGERAASGECPRDAVCNEHTPAGLYFRGPMFWDEPGERLGPVLAGGRFEVELLALEGTLGEYDVRSSDGGVLRAVATDGGMGVTGVQPGTAVVSVEDDRGALYDRLPLEVVAIDSVELSIVSDDERTAVLGGCTDMIGVRLLASKDGARLRAFDSQVRIEVSVGDARPDVGVWDCFRVEVPDDASEVTVTVHAGGEVFASTLEVVPVGDPELCPALTD